MSDGLEQLANTIQTYEKRLHGCKHDPAQILHLLQNWQVPILKDFGLALEQIIGSLYEVANRSQAALQLADQTFCGESLATASELASAIDSAMFGVDMPDEAREAIAALVELLEPWSDEDLDEEAEEDSPEPQVDDATANDNTETQTQEAIAQ